MSDMHADKEAEDLNVRLNDEGVRAEYEKKYANYRVHWLPAFLGGFLVGAGNLVYGTKPSYLKFRAVEVIARVPYHSWESAAFTFLTLFYMNEERAMKLSKVAWLARIAADNETMHVVVISKLAKQEQKLNGFVHTFIPMVFAFFYFWASYWLYIMNPKYSYELNYLFEQHAYDQYSEFLKHNAEALKKKPLASTYLSWYGRTAENQYAFFESVRNDELMHRNHSIEEIEHRAAAKKAAMAS
jgi:hypothetical protein